MHGANVSAQLGLKYSRNYVPSKIPLKTIGANEKKIES